MFYHYFFTADNVNAIRKIIQSCRIHFTFDFNTFRIEYIRLYVFIVRFYFFHLVYHAIKFKNSRSCLRCSFIYGKISAERFEVYGILVRSSNIHKPPSLKTVNTSRIATLHFVRFRKGSVELIFLIFIQVIRRNSFLALENIQRSVPQTKTSCKFIKGWGETTSTTYGLQASILS